MKLGHGIVCTCLFLISSVLLHGCDSGDGAIKSDAQQVANDIDAQLPKPPPAVKKAAAKCNGGHFHCDGAWTEWCSRMKKRCKPKNCAPVCSWTCDSPKCNQACGPVCNQPVCSTRCKGFNTDSCKMKCGKPNCKVVCPKHFCPSEDCAACKTECAKPVCKMECGNDEQPCRHVCAQPVCKWECKNPSLCPKPKCAMKCKKVPDCMQKMDMFSKVPPLEPGETEVIASEASAGGCAAEGGKRCVFPFKYTTANGVTTEYNGCTNKAHTGGTESFYWCATQVGPQGYYQFRSANWAKCTPSCPKASFLQLQSDRMRVNFTRMGADGMLHNGQVDLPLVQEAATDGQVDLAMMQVGETDAKENSWTRMATEADGQVTESEASCTSGKFHCQGDASWCAEQEKLGCKGGQTAFLRQRSQSQGHLQA